MMGCSSTPGGYARARAMRGRYRATPRPVAIRGEDMAKCLLMMLGLVTALMLIAFA